MNDTGRFPEFSPYLICIGWSAREAENPYASEHRGKSLQEALSFLDEGPQRGLVSQDRKTLTNNHFIPSNTTLTDSTNKASGEPRLRPCQSALGSSTPLPLLREVGKKAERAAEPSVLTGWCGCPVVSGETHRLVPRPGAVQVPAASSLGWCRRRPGRDWGLPCPPVVTGCPPHSDSRGSAGTSEGPRLHPTQGRVS